MLFFSCKDTDFFRHSRTRARAEQLYMSKRADLLAKNLRKETNLNWPHRDTSSLIQH